MICPRCGSENEAGRKFCGECGQSLALVCATCGTPNPPNVKFCGECGAPLQEVAAATAAPGTGPGSEDGGAAPRAERRLVSVLFADLVGFTTLSEQRDPEETRDLLTRYFDTCRRLIARYGGTVEKFIGDAVMAIWGAPVAQEDDAERAVRAALDLVQAVSDLGSEVGAPELRARGGVLTGEAAVTIGAEGQGMVAGDLVNTASRIQSLAEPGTVLVGDATRRATEAAVIYEDAGTHLLKGRTEPTPLHRALRVIGGRGGALRSTGLEAPFVGRDRELRLVKEMFHDSAEERKAHMVSVVGIAGIGKSRLSWEFFKYVDGLADTAYWHRGRSLAYGEGVTYWALAEMIRQRAGIAEAEPSAQAAEKLARSLEEHLPDPEERRWVEPRLAHILGLEERAVREREDLFAAARLFFERLAAEYPTILVFEDMQWAEPALVDFIEYLLDWSRNHPLFVLALARPEILERHPSWGTGTRSYTSLYLEPLSPEAMERLLAGLVPGLPPELRDRILDRAEGVPLYAVETVRMLIDRGLLALEGNEYRTTGPVADLEVPETLHALIAARLDGLSEQERRVLQDAAVLGKTFTVQAVSYLSDVPGSEVEPLLSSLVRKEVLSLQADPRSPERGQYGFLQDLVKRVAYETLSRRERRARHLAAAEHLQRESGYDEDEIVEVLAAHLLQANDAVPDAPDAGEIRARARGALVRAGRRAESLAANEEARRYYEQAAELAEDPVDRAGLLESGGIVAVRAGRSDEGQAMFVESARLFREAGLTHPAARVSARQAEALWSLGRLAEALELVEESFEVLSEEGPDADVAVLAAEAARLHFFSGHPNRTIELADLALSTAEALWLPETIAQALNTKHLALLARGRFEEAQALLKHALEVALEHDVPTAAARAYVNLSNLMGELDRLEDAVAHQTAGIALARRFGIRWAEWWLLGHLAASHFLAGRWDEALLTAAQIPDPVDEPGAATATSIAGWTRIEMHLAHGELDAAEEVLAQDWMRPKETTDVQAEAAMANIQAMVLLARGRNEEALEAAERGLARRGDLSLNHSAVRQSWVTAVEAALAIGDLERAEDLVRVVGDAPPGHVRQYVRAHRARLRGRLAAALGDAEGAEAGFKAGAGMFREMGWPYHLAVALAEHAEWLAGRGSTEAAAELAAEARETFARLGARPWLERLDARITVPAS